MIDDIHLFEHFEVRYIPQVLRSLREVRILRLSQPTTAKCPEGPRRVLAPLAVPTRPIDGANRYQRLGTSTSLCAKSFSAIDGPEGSADRQSRS